MADIRINALATTAASTASDDFIAVDGSANGTRKLDAYSPTFGGNLTVSGTITLSSNNWISSGTNLIRDSFFGYSTSYRLVQVGTTAGISLGADLTGNPSGSFNGSEIVIPNNRALIAANAANNGYVGVLKVGSDNKVYLGGNDYQTLGAVVLNGTSAEVAGNLTVSGTGTSSVAGTLNVSGGFILNRINAKGIYTGTSDNCGFTWTGTNGEFSTASGSLILKSAGTTALTLDSDQNATFAGTGQQSFNGIIQVAKTAAGANSNLLDLYNKGTTNNTSSGIAFSANNASSAQRTSAEIRGIMTVTTAGSEESELWFSTRGAGVASGTAALKIANTGNATFAGTVTPTGGIVGVTTNSNAAAGIVGEFVSSAVVSASAVSLTNATAANITSISLTAGDWDVTGLVQYNFTGATCSYVFHGFSTASAAFGAPNSYVQDYRNYTTASVSTHNPSLTFRISLAATTTIYFVTQADFSAGTVAAYGRIQARRVR